MTPAGLLARFAAVGVAFALVATVVGRPGVAGAHEGRGEFAVETAEPTAVGVRYVVRLTWVGDNHPAIDATVTATPIDPSGRAGTPVAFTPSDQDGRYQGEVPLRAPGTWLVRFTAVTPPATTEVTRDVTAPSTTTRPTSTSSTAPADPPAATESAPTVPAPDDSDGGRGGTVVFAGVLAAIGLVGALAYRNARRRRAP